MKTRCYARVKWKEWLVQCRTLQRVVYRQKTWVKPVLCWQLIVYCRKWLKKVSRKVTLTFDFFRAYQFLKIILQLGALVPRVKKGRKIFQKFRLISATNFIESSLKKTHVSWLVCSIILSENRRLSRDNCTTDINEAWLLNVISECITWLD